MASIAPHKDGYRVFVCVNNVRKTKTFKTKREANAWAAAMETQLRETAGSTPSERHTLAELIAKYRAEVTPHKRGRRWEEIRLDKFLADSALPTDRPLSEITSDVIGEWRNHRLTQVAPGSVLREIGLLSAVLEHARREWKWIAENPIRDVRKPTAPDHREVLIARDEIKAMLKAMGHRWNRRPSSVSQAVAMCFLVALRTGMRAGELCGLAWDRVFDDYCSTPHKTGKTQESLRHVPLDHKALRLIGLMRGWDAKLVFGVQSNTLDALFRKYRTRAGLSGFTFHDSRHTAATWMSKRVDVLTLCKIFGWKRTTQALTYYNPTASDIARQLSGKARK
jgi:integrase